jgi:hypothetical protein
MCRRRRSGCCRTLPRGRAGRQGPAAGRPWGPWGPAARCSTGAARARPGSFASPLGVCPNDARLTTSPGTPRKVGPEALGSLGAKFTAVKGRAPTRPHTLAPDKPVTGNVAANRMTAPLDKARDALSGRDV